MKELAKVFKALSDETKLQIYKIVVENPDICVCEIMSSLKMSQTRVSRNLGILKNAGLAEARREGFWMHYTVGKENKYNTIVKNIVAGKVKRKPSMKCK